MSKLLCAIVLVAFSAASSGSFAQVPAAGSPAAAAASEPAKVDRPAKKAKKPKKAKAVKKTKKAPAKTDKK